jgi:hypothetical protein
MILAGLGFILMAAGLAMALFHSGRNWTWPGTTAQDREAAGKRPIPPLGMILIGMGVALVLLATSGWL